MRACPGGSQQADDEGLWDFHVILDDLQDDAAFITQ